MPPTAVKFVDGSEDRIRGLAIPFGGPFAGKDFDGEDFGPDTDFAFDWFPTGRPVLYDHGLDGALKTTVQGRQDEFVIDAEGVWAEAQLDKSAKYHAAVVQLIRQGKLFFSSGAVPHLVEVDPAGHIKRWPWTELSLTPTPANPWATVHTVKSIDAIDHIRAAQIAVPGELVTAALKALDERTDDDSGSESFDRQVARVVSLVEEVVERAQKRIDVRAAKVGRELSTVNRQWLQSLDERLAGLEGLRGEIKQMLDKTDPDAKSALAAVLEAEATLARSLGVPLPN